MSQERAAKLDEPHVLEQLLSAADQVTLTAGIAQYQTLHATDPVADPRARPSFQAERTGPTRKFNLSNDAVRDRNWHLVNRNCSSGPACENRVSDPMNFINRAKLPYATLGAMP